MRRTGHIIKVAVANLHEINHNPHISLPAVVETKLLNHPLDYRELLDNTTPSTTFYLRLQPTPSCNARCLRGLAEV